MGLVPRAALGGGGGPLGGHLSSAGRNRTFEHQRLTGTTMLRQLLNDATLPGVLAPLAMAALLLQSPSGVAAADDTPSAITSNGITVEFAARAVGGDNDSDKIMAGRDVEVRFKVTDATTGTAVSNAGPGVWIDARKKVGVGVQKSGEADGSCREKIGYFLQRSLSYRPDIDLNAWYILALNRKASVTVIDPLFSYGGQRIVTLITLNSPGEDWVMGRDARSLFVALPATHEVAVIDTAIWKVTTNIKVGHNPVRVALQQDGRYLWVGHDGGVSVVDTERRAVVQQIDTGAGRHDIAFSKGDREAFVSNPTQGTVSVIDVGALNVVATIAVGGSPGAIAYSPLANMVYVADAKSGVISVIDPVARKVAATMQAKPGLYALRFTSDGRWGFAANPLANEVVILDASTNRIVNRIDVDGAPDQVSVSAKFAYVRSTISAELNLIAIDSLGKEQPPVVKTVPGGQNAPLADAGLPATAPVIVPTPDQRTVLVANPTDKAIYFYSEGMNAPMGSFQNMRREMRAALAVDRSLRETGPGVYTGHFRIPADGAYDVAFHMSSPRLSHCFTVTAERDPAFAARSVKPYRLEFLAEERDFAAGDTARVQFRLIDPVTSQPISDLTDLDMQIFQVPGTWRVLQPAKSLGDGIYEVAIELPRAGVYYLNVASRSLRARYNDLPSLVLRARESRIPAEKG
jgi:YVTN family beta-propeller protein